MLQQFVLRQAINLAVSVVIKLIDKHKKEFDPAKAQEAIEEKVRDLVPASMWGEAWVENKLIGAVTYVCDRMCQSADGLGELTEQVLTALASQNLAGAISAVRNFVLRVVGADTMSAEQGEEALLDDQFADNVILAAFEDGADEEPTEEEGESDEQPKE